MKTKRLQQIFALALSATMTFAMVACGAETAEPTEQTKPTQAVETQPTVEEEAPELGVNLLENGDFSDGKNQWSTYCMDGMVDLSVTKDGELDVDIKKVGSVAHGVQIYHDGFRLEEGCVYNISFDAYADVERPGEMRFQINGGDYHAYYMEQTDFTTEKTHYEYSFTMEETSDPAPRFCYNLGLVGDMSTDMEEHHIYFDNFSLTMEDASGKVASTTGVQVPDIAVNQIGYLPKAYKSATIKGSGLNQTAKLINEKNGKVVLKAEIGGGELDKDSKDMEAVFDFTKVKKAGTYHIEAGDAVSPSFRIGKDVYDDAMKAAIKMLYYQRCGMELTEEYAGDFAHPDCHHTEAVLYEDTSKKLDVSGGWHDAGDYGR